VHVSALPMHHYVDTMVLWCMGRCRSGACVCMGRHKPHHGVYMNGAWVMPWLASIELPAVSETSPRCRVNGCVNSASACVTGRGSRTRVRSRFHVEPRPRPITGTPQLIPSHRPLIPRSHPVTEAIVTEVIGCSPCYRGMRDKI
jgi:hypothetical protein